MTAKRQATLGEREIDLLEELWEGGEMTAADVQRRLQSRGIDLAFNSVQTMLGRLHEKGVVSRRLDGRTYFYEAIAKQQSVAGGALQRLAARFFGGSRAELAAHLVRSGLKKEDLDRLQALIDEQRVSSSLESRALSPAPRRTESPSLQKARPAKAKK